MWVSPGASDMSRTRTVLAFVYEYGLPIHEVTLRPSGFDSIVTVIPASLVWVRITTGASQSFWKMSSGPPQDTVASRPVGYREIQNECGVWSISLRPEKKAAL